MDQIIVRKNGITIHISWLYRKQDLDESIARTLIASPNELFLTNHNDMVSIASFIGLADVTESATGGDHNMWWKRCFDVKHQKFTTLDELEV